MEAYKWNFKTHKYKTYNLPIGSVLIADIKDVVSCANCGTKHEYGTMYTSNQIHNDMGFGYAVCQRCYDEEWRERRQYDN